MIREGDVEDPILELINDAHRVLRDDTYPAPARQDSAIGILLQALDKARIRIQALEMAQHNRELREAGILETNM